MSAEEERAMTRIVEIMARLQGGGRMALGAWLALVALSVVIVAVAAAS